MTGGDPERESRAALAAGRLPLTPDPDRPGEVVDAAGVTWSSPAAALTVGVLGLCGCGSGEQIEADVTVLLAGVRPIGGPRRPLPELDGELYRELLLHLLDNAGLVDHGSSVTAGWRTELGEAWLEALGG